MRKEIIGQRSGAAKSQDDDWLDLDLIASVQLTSEDPEYPIENALSKNPERNEMGWRAAAPGPQTITLTFDTPQRVRRIHLLFIEHRTERTQEFVLSYSSSGEAEREIVRQQWNFSPTGASQEIEDYVVEIGSMTKLQLVIDPDRGPGRALATLNTLRLA